jgi:hypothetical protein
MSTEDILTKRQTTHGDFAKVAAVAGALKAEIFVGLKLADKDLSSEHLEVLNMICTKLARIVCGNSLEQDHWKDIAGYAELGRRACE